MLSIVGFIFSSQFLDLGYKTYAANPLFKGVVDILFVTQGIYMTMLRLSEPAFFNVTINELKSFFDFICCTKAPKGMRNDS